MQYHLVREPVFVGERERERELLRHCVHRKIKTKRLSKFQKGHFKVMASSSDDQGHGATFDSLPDELVLKIVKLAAQSEYRLLNGISYDHKYR